MERKFGIEMEIAGISRETALSALHAVNINAEAEDYNHTTRTHWKIVSDSSVRGGFEIVSPILVGETGIAEAEVAARALDDAGATVNSTCGLHVHFDASDLDVNALKNILRRYAAFEGQIDAFMPRSRRGNENGFCKSIRDFVARQLENIFTIDALVARQSGRYYKVNLQSILRHGTIEFRQHSGTVNAAKIANWVRFLAAFIDQCKAGNNQETVNSQDAPEISRLSGVQKRLANMFRNEGPVTLARMMEVFGWRDISARAAVTRLRKAGMEIRATRVDGRPAYMFNGASGAASRPDSLWAGIEQSVAMFYQRRAAVLAVAA